MRALLTYFVVGAGVTAGFIIGIARGIARGIAEANREAERLSPPAVPTVHDLAEAFEREERQLIREHFAEHGLQAVGAKRGIQRAPQHMRPNRKLRGIEIIESGGGHGGDAA